MSKPRTPKHRSSRWNYLKLPLLIVTVVVMLAGGVALVAHTFGLTYTDAKSWVKPDRQYTIPVAVASTPPAKSAAQAKAQSCPTPPVGKADYRLVYTERKGEGVATVNGRLVTPAQDTDWLSSYYPNQKLARSGTYQWTLSPYGTTQRKGGGAYAVVANSSSCIVVQLTSTESDITYDVGGVKVPATRLTLVPSFGYRLVYVVIAVFPQDRRQAN